MQETRWASTPGLPSLRLHLFGRMRAESGSGRSVLPRSRKTQALLAVLAIAAPQPVLRAQLTALLWSQRQQEQARASLRQAVHELQAVLGDECAGMVRADRNQLGLSSVGLWVDAVAFSRAINLENQWLVLFRERFLDDLYGIDPAFDAWLLAQTARLKQIARTLGEGAMAEPGPPHTLVEAAGRLLQVDRTHEVAWRALIAAHAQNGDRSAALAAYEQCRVALAEAAQLAPSSETERLVASLRQIANRSVPGTLPPDHAPGHAPGHAAMPASIGSGAIRLGVLPLRCMDPARDSALALGLTEEITSGLARLRWISCVPGSVLAGGDHAGPGNALTDRVDFLLEGSIQRDDSRIRVIARLLDMRTAGEVVWTRRFDRAAGDVLALQEEIAAETVAQLDPELLLREGMRAAGRGGHPNAQDLVLRAIPAIYRLDRIGFQRARGLLEQALALDPDHAAAHAWLAYWNLFHVGQGWADDPGASIRGAAELVERAVTLDPADARALTLAGHVRSYLTKRAAEGCALHDRALSLNPNLALAWCFSGLSNAYMGHHDEAIRRMDIAHRLSPHDPHGFFFDMALTMPHLLSGRHEQAVEIGRRAIELNPGFSSSYKGYLAALGHLGRRAEAVEVRDRLLTLEPGFTLGAAQVRSPICRAADLDHYLEGLRLGGLT